MNFKNKFDFLSNMYICPVMYKDILFAASEIAYVYAKCADAKDREIVASMRNPYEAKKFGKEVLLREDWEDIKLEVMVEIVRDKFNRNPILAQKLKTITDPMIVEDNYWGDTYWGRCNGVGSNYLGVILTMIRKELRVAEGQVTSNSKDKYVNKLETGRIVLRVYPDEENLCTVVIADVVKSIADGKVKFETMPSYTKEDEDYMFKPDSDGICKFFVAPADIEQYRYDNVEYKVPREKLQEWSSSYVSVFN